MRLGVRGHDITADIPASTLYPTGCSAANAVRSIGAKHEISKETSITNGAVSADWNMERNTATSPRHCGKFHCKAQFWQQSTPP